MAERIFDGLDEAERTFREQYRRERWLKGVRADHKSGSLLVSVRGTGTESKLPHKWKEFPVTYHPAEVTVHLVSGLGLSSGRCLS